MSKKYSDKGFQKSLWGGWDDMGDYKGKPTTTTPVYKSCFESHPPLKIGEFVIYGGSCSRPVIKDADIYVGLDSGIQLSHRSWPWEAGEEFLYHITDMCAPKDLPSFKKLIEYLATRLEEGKKVHVGCIGGHGRTGTVFAALVHHMLKIEDPISYVRENYCKKAVESQEQVDFLVKWFGAKKVAPVKEMGGYSTKGGKGHSTFTTSSGGSSYYKGGTSTGSSRGNRVPMIRGADANIWGARK